MICYFPIYIIKKKKNHSLIQTKNILENGWRIRTQDGLRFADSLNSLYGCNLNDDIVINGFSTEIFFNDDPFTKHTLFLLFLFEHNINYLSYLNREVDKYEKCRIRKVPFVPFNVRVEFNIGVKTNLNKKPINSIQTFKFDECVICLTNQPIILFCNCGHIPICTECYKLKSLSVCPACKTENEIIRMLE